MIKTEALRTEIFTMKGYPKDIELTVIPIENEVFLLVDRPDGKNNRIKNKYVKSVVKALKKINKEDLVEASKSVFQFDIPIKSGEHAPLSVHKDEFGRIIAVLHY
jgi:hypothetical protein